MANITLELEAQYAKIKEAQQRYEEAKRNHDPLKMKATIDDIGDIQKTIQRLRKDEARHLTRAIRDVHTATHRQIADDLEDLAKQRDLYSDEEYETVSAMIAQNRKKEAGLSIEQILQAAEQADKSDA